MQACFHTIPGDGRETNPSKPEMAHSSPRVGDGVGHHNRRNGYSMKRTCVGFDKIILVMVLLAMATFPIEEIWAQQISRAVIQIEEGNYTLPNAFADPDPCQTPITTDKSGYFRINNTTNVLFSVDTCSCVQPPCQCSVQLYSVTYDPQNGTDIYTFIGWSGLHDCTQPWSWCAPSVTPGRYYYDLDVCEPNSPNVTISCGC